MRRRPLTILGRVAVGVAFALSIAAAPVSAAPPGAIDTGACIAFDTHGYRYIAFGRTGVAEPGIYLATNRSGTWRLSPHPVTPGERCASIMVDALGRVHLLAVRPIVDDPNGLTYLYYATDKSGAWRASRVHYGEIGTASLAIDRTGRANIAISDEDGVFVFRRAANGGWTTAYSTTGRLSHLRVDPSGGLWLVVLDVSHLRVVRLMNQSGSWTVSRIPIHFSRAINVELAIDRLSRRFFVVHDGITGTVNIYRDSSSGLQRVDRTRVDPGRLMLEATSEPSGAIHLMLGYARSPTGLGIVDQNRHTGSWRTQLVGYVSGFRADIDVDRRGRVGATFERDGVVWSYWNNWIGPPHRFRVSDL